MPLLMGGILAFMIYDSYEILCSPLLKDLLIEQNVQMDLAHELIGFLLQLTFLISNIVLLIRRGHRTPPEP